MNTAIILLNFFIMMGLAIWLYRVTARKSFEEVIQNVLIGRYLSCILGWGLLAVLVNNYMPSQKIVENVILVECIMALYMSISILQTDGWFTKIRDFIMEISKFGIIPLIVLYFSLISSDVMIVLCVTVIAIFLFLEAKWGDLPSKIEKVWKIKLCTIIMLIIDIVAVTLYLMGWNVLLFWVHIVVIAVTSMIIMDKIKLLENKEYEEYEDDENWEDER